MEPVTTTKRAFFAVRRNWILMAGIVLFMPPLSLLFQLTQDADFCGTWCPRMFFTWSRGESAGSVLMGMARSYMGVALVAGAMVSTLFLGRFWCSHLCPIGGTAELGSRLLPRALKVRLDAIPAPAVRYGYLSAYLLLPALGLGSLCCSYCNFATVPRLLGAPFSQADMAYFLRTAGLMNLGLLVGLGFLTRGGRGYCNLLCPVGALDALANRLGERFGRRTRVDAERCNGCGLCKEACPVWAIEIGRTAAIDQLSCIPCGGCARICPQGAIAYGRKQPGLEEQPRTVPACSAPCAAGKGVAP